ncbi:hypothetical protein EAO68_05545 [Streptomyces sp. wa22]|nr:hypothetical protein EAO68_05545 [Streptomyces sp. wa22]
MRQRQRPTAQTGRRATPDRAAQDGTTGPRGRASGGKSGREQGPSVHEGAVHLHQGRTYLVRSLDLEDAVALVEEAVPPYSTNARDTTAISVLETGMGAEDTVGVGP